MDVDNVERILLLVIEKYGIKGDLKSVINKAEDILYKLNLTIILGDELLENLNLRCALSSVINSGKRAFKGGIKIVNSEAYLDVELPGYVNSTLGDLIKKADVYTSTSYEIDDQCICIGHPALNENHIELKANSWQGGIIPFGQSTILPETRNFSLAGNLAAGFAVAYCFMNEIGIMRNIKKPLGISLWRPDLDWLDKNANGPDIHYLPNKYWIVGLGHLGQSFQWVLSQLPIETINSVEVTLQDFDRINKANFSAGLLSEFDSFGRMKTRVSGSFLEQHGFQTRIIERVFDKTVKFSPEDDPAIVLCGVDSAIARKNMDQKSFPMFLDSGLGGSLATFDSMVINNFMVKELDNSLFETTESNVIHRGIDNIEKHEYECGVLSTKAISSSFIGLINSAFVFSEVIRSFNQGKAYETIDFSFREFDDLIAISDDDSYDLELLKYGKIEVFNQ